MQSFLADVPGILIVINSIIMSWTKKKKKEVPRLREVSFQTFPCHKIPFPKTNNHESVVMIRANTNKF